MNNVEIGIQINIDGVCSKTMSYDNAKRLYESLSKIFFGGISYYNPETSNYHNTKTVGLDDVRCSTSNKAAGINPLRDKIEKRMDKPSIDSVAEIKQHNPIKDRMDDANRRIDAARERAAARTSQCGSSRSCS